MSKQLNKKLNGFTRINSKRSLGGFTIIEVMIVLAIAALILLVVFLAVPALQRSQRNSARKSDAARIATSVVEYTANNQGALPTTAANCTSIKNSAATLSQYSSLGANCNAEGTSLPATPTANIMYIEVMAANGTAMTATNNVMVIATKSSCNGNASTTFDSATSSKVALLYTIEAGTAWDWACINPQ